MNEGSRTAEQAMAERSFKKEVQKLKLGAGEEFRGEGILAITKALLQCGVSYVAGYQGAPISHLMDVLSDANDILEELGVHFESSASEAAAAATLAASVNYPLRGAVTFKAPVGTNVASDALANLSSGGVTGGALIIVGEDYGEGSSIMQERSHAYAMKSQIWLLDPRPNLPSIVNAVEKGFELSEASNTPVMLEVRIRACHVHGRFPAKDNVRPSFTLRDALENPRRQVDRIVLPPASYLHEREKIEKRWPAAVKFVTDNKLNEFFDGDLTDIGIIMQGGMYNTTLRALEVMGLADAFGASRVPLYVLNVTYPLIDQEVVRFAQGKRAVLVVEEGQPEFIEQAINTILRRADVQTIIEGKSMLPMAGEYTGGVVRDGLTKFVRAYRADVLAAMPHPAPSNEAASAARGRRQGDRAARAGASAVVLHRLPGTSDFHRHEARRARARPAARELRHRLSPVFDPAAIQHRRHHHGLRPGWRRRIGVQHQIRQTRDRDHGRRRLLAQRPRIEHRQRRVQQVEQRPHHCRQRLHGRHRRSGHHVLGGKQQDSRHQEHNREGGARRRCRLGPHDHEHVQRCQDARHVARGADHAPARPQGDHRPIRMHAQQAAARAPADGEGD